MAHFIRDQFIGGSIKAVTSWRNMATTKEKPRHVGEIGPGKGPRSLQASGVGGNKLLENYVVAPTADPNDGSNDLQNALLALKDALGNIAARRLPVAGAKQHLQEDAQLESKMKYYREIGGDTISSIYTACADMCAMLHLQATLEESCQLYAKIPPTIEDRQQCYNLLKDVIEKYHPPKIYTPASDLDVLVREQLKNFVLSYAGCLNMLGMLHLGGLPKQRLTRGAAAKHAYTLFEEAISYGDDSTKCGSYHLAKIEFLKGVRGRGDKARAIRLCKKHVKEVKAAKDDAYLPGARFYETYIESTKGFTGRVSGKLGRWCTNQGKNYEYYWCKLLAENAGNDEVLKEIIYTDLLDGKKFNKSVGGAYREQKAHAYLGASQAKQGKIVDAVRNLLIGARVASRTVWDGLTRVVSLILQPGEKVSKPDTEKALCSLSDLYKDAFVEEEKADLGAVVAGVIGGEIATGGNIVSNFGGGNIGVFFENIGEAMDESCFNRFANEVEGLQGEVLTREKGDELRHLFLEFRDLCDDLNRFQKEQVKALDLSLVTSTEPFPYIRMKRLCLCWNKLEVRMKHFGLVSIDLAETVAGKKWIAVETCMSVLYLYGLARLVASEDLQIQQQDFEEPMIMTEKKMRGGIGEIYPTTMRELAGEEALGIGPKCMETFFAGRKAMKIRGVPMMGKFPMLEEEVAEGNPDVAEENNRRMQLHAEEIASYKKLGSHPNIARVYTPSVDSGSEIYLYMRNEGKDVSEMVKMAVEGGESGLDPEWLVRIIVQVLRGLSHVHRKNLVHGDMKINNIVINSAGRVRIIDFGSGGEIGVPLRALGQDSRYPEESVYMAEVDMWAVGLLVCHALFPPDDKHTEFDGICTYLQKTDVYQELVDQWGSEYYDLLTDKSEDGLHKVIRELRPTITDGYKKVILASKPELIKFIGTQLIKRDPQKYRDEISKKFREDVLAYMKTSFAEKYVENINKKLAKESLGNAKSGDDITRALKDENTRAYLTDTLINLVGLCLNYQWGNRPDSDAALQYLYLNIPNLKKIMDTVDSGSEEVPKT